MKKIIFILVIMLTSLGASATAYAGSINANEQAVLGAAEQIYMYNGIAYKLTESTISQIRDYLAQDGVDLTVEQTNEALSQVNSYIKQGIDGGYLVRVDGQPNEPDAASGSNNTASDASGSTGQGSDTSGTSAAGSSGTDNSSKDNSGSSGTVNSAADSSGYQYPGSDISQYIGNIGHINSSYFDAAQKKNQAVSDENVDEFINGLLSGKNEYNASDEITADNSGISEEEDNLAIFNSDTESKYTVNTVIKDTGFNLNSTFAVAVLMGVIMLAGIIVTVRFNYFAQKNE